MISRSRFDVVQDRLKDEMNRLKFDEVDLKKKSKKGDSKRAPKSVSQVLFHRSHHCDGRECTHRPQPDVKQVSSPAVTNFREPKGGSRAYDSVSYAEIDATCTAAPDSIHIGCRSYMHRDVAEQVPHNRRRRGLIESITWDDTTKHSRRHTCFYVLDKYAVQYER